MSQLVTLNYFNDFTLCLVKIIMSINIFTWQHLTSLRQKRRTICSCTFTTLLATLFLLEMFACLRFLSGCPEAPPILVLVYAIATCGSHSGCMWHSLGPTGSSTYPCMPEYHRYYHQQEVWENVCKSVQLLKCQVWMHSWESSHTCNENFAAMEVVQVNSLISSTVLRTQTMTKSILEM